MREPGRPRSGKSQAKSGEHREGAWMLGRAVTAHFPATFFPRECARRGSLCRRRGLLSRARVRKRRKTDSAGESRWPARWLLDGEHLAAGQAEREPVAVVVEHLR